MMRVQSAICCHTFSIILVTSSVAAQTPAGSRADVILAAVGDVNGDGQLQANELSSFLTHALPVAFAEMGWGRLEVPADWARSAAQFVVNQADGDFNGALGPSEFPALEAAILFDALGIRFGNLLPPAAVKQPGPLGTLDRVQRWLSIRRSFLENKDVARPASIAWRTFDDEDETVKQGFDRRQREIHAAISLVPAVPSLVWEIGALEVFPQFGYEAHLSTGLKTEADTITHRIGMKGSVLGNVSSIFVGHLFDLTYDLETDGGYQRDVRGWTAQYSPVAPKLAIGQLHPAEGLVQFHWRPYIGIQAAEVKDDGDEDLAAQPEYADLFLRVTFQLRAFARLIVTPQVTQFKQLRGLEEEHTLVEVGTEFAISQTADGDARVSLEFSATYGKSSPTYAQQQSAGLTLGVKF
jgi:hypothetical protein